MTNKKTFEVLNKIDTLLEEIENFDFINEDYHGADYCIFCNARYGNYIKFGYVNKTVQENHEPNCIYRMAVELKEELS